HRADRRRGRAGDAGAPRPAGGRGVGAAGEPLLEVESAEVAAAEVAAAAPVAAAGIPTATAGIPTATAVAASVPAAAVSAAAVAPAVQLALVQPVLETVTVAVLECLCVVADSAHAGEQRAEQERRTHAPGARDERRLPPRL